jgi:tetratricopeptide (TPR) repeat protein
MNVLRKLILLFVLVVVAAVEILIYWNMHLYYRAKDIKNHRKKIEILERANQIYPINDLVFYERGKAYCRLGNRSLNDIDKSEAYLRESIQNFNQSIRINPASYFSHHRLARSLLFMSYISESLDFNPYEEYKKVALLLGHNHRIYYDVGKILLSRWGELSKEDRDFTLEILIKIARGRDRDKLQTIMQIWEMNVKDYGVMEKILPEGAQVYNMYAKFLGEKSLSIEERQRMLARAEFLEFERAKSESSSGENDFLYFRVKEALEHFKFCLNGLERIKFYQNLTQQTLIDHSEFNSLRKSTFLNLTKCRLEEGGELKEVEGYLRNYLALEDKVPAIGELESYLKNRGLISEELDASFDDMDLLSLQLLLYFKQNRYRDIVKIGRLLQQSFVVVPEEKREGYVRILQLLGDSFQKIDYIYDAGEFYQKALVMEPENMGTLLRSLQNYERLNEDEKILETKERIDNVVAPPEIIHKNLTINKGRGLARTLTLDGRKVTLDLHFEKSEEGIIPLISVFFNGQVVWEDYLKDEVISLSVESKTGKNIIQVISVNRAVSLIGLKWETI